MFCQPRAAGQSAGFRLTSAWQHIKVGDDGKVIGWQSSGALLRNHTVAQDLNIAANQNMVNWSRISLGDVKPVIRSRWAERWRPANVHRISKGTGIGTQERLV